VNEQDKTLATLRQALQDLRRRWPIRSLTLFGSVVRGEASPANDLDILVEFDKAIRILLAAYVGRPIIAPSLQTCRSDSSAPGITA
jgi:predicted nucleotidyltransferase